MIPKIYLIDTKKMFENSVLKNCLKCEHCIEPACGEGEMSQSEVLPTELSTDSVDIFWLELLSGSAQAVWRINLG
jgi:hypothetical protein